MGFTVKHKFFLGLIILELFAGSVNYLLFRPNILFFSFFTIHFHRYAFPSALLQTFFNGYFSDVVWCLALCQTVIILSEKGLINNIEKIILLLLPFLTETAQYFKIFPGNVSSMTLIKAVLLLPRGFQKERITPKTVSACLSEMVCMNCDNL